MENEVKLTKLAKCAGCGAKVGAGVLAQLLEGIPVEDPAAFSAALDQILA